MSSRFHPTTNLRKTKEHNKLPLCTPRSTKIVTTTTTTTVTTTTITKETSTPISDDTPVVNNSTGWKWLDPFKTVVVNKVCDQVCTKGVLRYSVMSWAALWKITVNRCRVWKQTSKEEEERDNRKGRDNRRSGDSRLGPHTHIQSPDSEPLKLLHGTLKKKCYLVCHYIYRYISKKTVSRSISILISRWGEARWEVRWGEVRGEVRGERWGERWEVRWC